MRLADRTTLRLGGPAGNFVIAGTETELVEAVSAADRDSSPVLLLGGGSNLVVADAGFCGTVIAVQTSDVVEQPDTCAGLSLTASAGVVWDDVVALAIERGWAGIEALSGIPGTVGATPLQNVGAYGQEVAQTIESVRTWDRHEGKIRTFANAQCGFTYRNSRFKAEPARYLILSVTFGLQPADLGTPVAYAELARALGINEGERAPLARVREAVLALRRGKAMVLDPDDRDTWSAGSFFTNPLLEASQVATLPDDAPRFAQADGRVKTSAAWLIEHAGFVKGQAVGGAAISSKHILALTNHRQATTEDLMSLARQIRDGVWARFAIGLEPEPVFVGCSL